MPPRSLLSLLRSTGWIVALALSFLLGSLFVSSGNRLPRSLLEPVAAATLLETTAGTTLLSYQGRITNPATNVPLPDGTFGVNFSLFDAASGGTQLWTEARSVEQQRGLITVLLGEVTALPLTIFDGRDLWLQLQVNGETLSPRQRLAWVAYAINARKAETVIDNAITSAKIADGQVTATDLADGSGSGVDADLIDGRDSTFFAAANHGHATLPIAYGFVDANGTKFSGTSNYSSLWNAAQNRYEITISGVNYFYADFATAITPACDLGITSTNSVSGRLLVRIASAANAPIQCPFQFIVFRP